MGRHHNRTKGLFYASSPRLTEYRTNLKHARHGGFQTLDVERRTDSLRPLDRPPGTMTGTDEGRRKTKTETGEDGDRRRRRQTKTETDEDGDSRRRRPTHSGDERSGSSITADDTPE